MRTYFDSQRGFLVCFVLAEDAMFAEEMFRFQFPDSPSVNSRTVYKREESRMAGILGEIVFKRFMGERVSKPNNIKSDFILPDGRRVDVKCKLRTVPPLPEYEASMFAYQAGMASGVDLYVFMSTTRSFQKVWICGAVASNDFHEQCVLWRKGDVDSSNQKEFHEDTLSMRYNRMCVVRSPETILNIPKKN